MRRSPAAALALGGLLVAGCGSTAPLDFRGQSRPAPPVDVSVYLSGHRPQLDPAQVPQGPVQFEITNQTGSRRAVAITAANGRLITRTPPIAPGGTAQLQVAGGLSAYGVQFTGRRRSRTLLSFKGSSTRAGDSALLQP
jgi:hypothetical protein